MKTFKFLIIGLLLLSPFGLKGQIKDSIATTVYDGWLKAYIYNNTSDPKAPYFCESLAKRTRTFFWGQAYLITAVIDAYEKAPTPERKNFISDLLNRFLVQDQLDWTWDSWNDDMQWGIIVFARGYQVTGEIAFLNAAKNNFDKCYARGWDSRLDGGIWENMDNVPNGGKCGLSNWPQIIAGCEIYETLIKTDSDGAKGILDKCENIYNWGRTHIWDPSTGRVYEGMSPETTNNFTGDDNSYNYGLLVNSATSLYKITKNPMYLEDAIRVADKNIAKIASSNGIMVEDKFWNGGFGGEQLARGIAKLCRQNYLWNKYWSFLSKNCAVAWSNRRLDYNFTHNDFSTPTQTSGYDFAAMELTGCVTIQQVTPKVQSIPNTIEAENYNFLKDVTIPTTIAGGATVKSLKAGDWIEYIINVPSNGSYTINYVVSGTTAGSIVLQQNGLSLDTTQLPSTADNQTFSTVSTKVNLKAGIQSIKFIVNSGDWNFDRWSAALETAFKPGTIQAEDYTAMNGVTIENLTDGNTGKDVTSISNGDWMDYTVDIPTTGTYSITYRVAGTGTGSVSMQQNGQTLATTSLPVTGIQTWKNINATVNLTAGQQTIRLLSNSTGWAFDWWSAELNKIPTVSIVAPKDTTFKAPGTYTMYAAASDTDGNISKVEFYNGTSLIGTDYTSPYSYTWNNATKGTYTITAKATDNLGAVSATSLEKIKITVTNDLPTVKIYFPTKDTTVVAPRSITIKASAADTDGLISKVVFYAGTLIVGEDYTSPYSCVWTGTTKGIYSITAKAIDNAGSTTTSAITCKANITNVPAVVTFLTPTADTTIKAGSIILKIKATDTDGSIANVEFFNGTTSLKAVTSTPFQYTWSVSAPGIYPISVKVTDNGGQTVTSKTVNIRVSNVSTTLPTVNFITPSADTTFTPGTSITLQATASDADGTVSKVEYYNGATKIGTGTGALYQFVWNNIPSANYIITARVTDNGGFAKASKAIKVLSNGPIVGVQSVSSDAINIYPNPVVYQLNVNVGDQQIKDISIADYRGRIVYTSTKDYEGTATIDVSNLQSGMYIISVRTNKSERIIQKFVK